MTTKLHYGDLLDLDADAIVNAANTELQHGGSLAAAIVRAGGSSIQEESDGIGWCDLGSAVYTSAGSLSASYVIHVPTIDYTSGRRATLEDIARSTRAALELARNLGARKIAFPLLGAGFVGLKAVRVARAMKEVMEDFEDVESVLCLHWQSGWEKLRLVFEE